MFISARAALIAAVVAVLGLTAAGCAQTVPGQAGPGGVAAPGSAAAPPTSTPAAAPTSAASGGYTLSMPEFSLMFPGKPVETTRPLPQDASLILHFYVYQPVGRYSLNAGYIDYPAAFSLGDPATVLQNVARGAVGAVPNGKIVSATPTTVNGRPALDVVGSAKGGTVLARFALDKRRLYEVITAGEGDLTSTHQAFASSLVIH